MFKTVEKSMVMHTSIARHTKQRDLRGKFAVREDSVYLFFNLAKIRDHVCIGNDARKPRR